LSNQRESTFIITKIATMSEQNTYEAQVERIAEILHNKYWEYDGQEAPPFEDENTSPELWDQARAMVAEMAMESIAVWIGYFGVSEDEPQIRQWLIKRGLIPATEVKVDPVIKSYADKAAERVIPRNDKTIAQLINEGATCGVCGSKYKIINCVSFCTGCGRERN
jgi:hypothetical protein